MIKIAILDYGVGNLFSIQTALNKLKVKTIVTSELDSNEEYNGIILPGVGGWKHTVKKIEINQRFLQDFHDSNKEELITHFLKTGYCSEEGHAEYLFHGNKDDILSDCVFASTDFMIKKIMSIPPGKIADLYLGAFTLQRWNVTTGG